MADSTLDRAVGVLRANWEREPRSPERASDDDLYRAAALFLISARDGTSAVARVQEIGQSQFQIYRRVNPDACKNIAVQLSKLVKRS